jgi:hypothetical protein
MFLDVLDDVFLLHFPFETAKRAFNGLTFLNLYFCQGNTPPSCSRYPGSPGIVTDGPMAPSGNI